MFWLLSVISLSSLAAAALLEEPLPQHKFGASARASDWEIGGSAAFINHALRLTADRQAQSGYLWAKKPLDTVGYSWTLDMEFRIFGQGVTLFGDGMALWVTKERFSAGKGPCCHDAALHKL